ncbi:DUF305 domain-containing protein [Phycicoccus sp. BSK3Z-2]|uniref:DUF305 domain-containing protein n=1 Tax=Phycicoccus avicenniae TaxID=2828860 RepID=A0A941D6S5_9MICO|nr:DUF305 domain-containing protein [Phycicoccus avicenniae]MBR7742666.1 DUF305 domain-containing protein [Phycicoccus avicenniae]
MRPSRPSLAPARAAVVGVLLAALAAGCSGDPVATPEPNPGSVPVLQPGRPGEPNATLSGPGATSVPVPTASSEDARFLQEMIAHHAQAIVMVESVGDRFGDDRVASLASRIRDEQGPEIEAMATWLRGHGEDVPPEATNPRLSDHSSHAGMPGMASRAELTRLSGLSGAEADTFFLAMMIRHHEGALTMVDEHAEAAADERVQEISADIAVVQTKQIAQMQEMLSGGS